MSNEWTPPGTTEKIPNYLVPAIISAVCCFPLGIISIVFAAQVNSKVAAGDIPGAMDASKKASCLVTFSAESELSDGFAICSSPL